MNHFLCTVLVAKRDDNHPQFSAFAVEAADAEEAMEKASKLALVIFPIDKYAYHSPYVEELMFLEPDDNITINHILHEA